MSRLGDELEELKYYCSNENPDKKLRNTYRQLRLVWILTLVFTVVVPVLWIVRVLLRINLPLVMCIIITAIWVIMVAFSIFSWKSATQ